MKKIIIFISFGCLLLFAVCIIYCQRYYKMYNNGYTLKHTTAIFTEEDKSLPFFIFPKGATLYYDSDSKYLDGFSRYLLYVNISDGETDLFEKLSGKYISPIWLYKIDKDIFEHMVHNSSLSRSELIQIIKQSGISKKDLEDILRDMTDANR